MRHFEADGTEYVDQIRMIETTDPGHADVLNRLFQSLVNNDMFLKNLSQKILEQIKNVDNTHDLDKPVSVPVQEALDAYYVQLTAYADKAIADLINGAPTTLDTLKELADAIKKNQDVQAALDAAIGTKASQKEFDSHVATMANKTVSGHVKVDDALSVSSTNPVQNKAVKTALDEKSNTSHTHNYAGSSSAGGSANSAAKLETARTIDGVLFNGSEAIIHYGTCSTATATAAKVVACTGFMLVTGATIRVKFTNINSASSPTLNVNDTGAKAIYYRGKAITANYLRDNKIYEFVYNGTQYELVGDIKTYRIGLYKLSNNWGIQNTVGATTTTTATHIAGDNIGGGGTGVLVNCSLPYITISSISYMGNDYNVTLKRTFTDNNVQTTGASDAYVIIIANEV